MSRKQNFPAKISSFVYFMHNRMALKMNLARAVKIRVQNMTVLM